MGWLLSLLLPLGAQAAAHVVAPVLADLHREIDLSEPVLSPDARLVAFTATIHNLAKDAAQSQIWVVGYDGEGKRQISPPGDASEWHPRWTPDGKTLVYLSDLGDEGTQIWARDLTGGAARQITHLEEGVADFDLSPDGSALALISQEPRGAPKGLPEPPFVTERFLFMDDDEGLLDQHRRHLYRASMNDGKPVLLTQGAHDEYLPSWSPDGRLIAFVTRRGADADRHANFDLYTVEAKEGGVERQITSFPGPDDSPDWLSRPSWSPDGNRIAYLQGGDEKDLEYAVWQLAVVDLTNLAVRVPAPIDRDMFQPKWSSDGRSITVRIEQPESTYVARIDPVSGQVRYLTSGRRFDAEFDTGAGGRVVVLGGDETSPYELYAVEDRLRPLSHMNNAWLEGLALQPQEDFTTASPDGTEIHGFLVRPPGMKAGQPVPTILRIHGGPVYQFSHEFMFDWQYFAARGYAVVAVNPRGSSGRGGAFARAIYADWGHLDAEDVLAGLDHVVAEGVADPARLGVGGWSYGGILTDYLIADDHRFKAAVSGAGSGNMLGMYGADEYARDYEIELGQPWANTDLWLKLSRPFFHADRITTPTLFLCAGDDVNVPCEGAYQMYQALQSLKIPTRLIRFPKQHHEPTIPSYLEFRLASYVAWYDRFLLSRPAAN